MDPKGSEQALVERLYKAHLMHTKDKVEILEALRKRFGGEVVEIARQVECEKARTEWTAIASKVSDHSIDNLVNLLWEPLRAQGFEFKIDRTTDGVQIACSKCPIADIARKIDGCEWLFHLTCSVDPFIAEGFNANIGLKRTKTLMQGHDCCDHRYFLKNRAGG